MNNDKIVKPVVGFDKNEIEKMLKACGKVLEKGVSGLITNFNLKNNKG